VPWSFWASYLLKLGVVALIVAALYAGARWLRRLRRLTGRGDRSLYVIETVALSQHAVVALLGVGTRYFMVGAAGTEIALLAEVAPAEVAPPGATR
jgi:flagellar biogenesis protein FliO